MEPLAANEIKTTQKLLTDLGYQAGPIDGQYGQKTENALVQFYNSQGLGFDGKLGSNEILDLKFELARFNVTADEINFPGSFYTSELKPCTAMGYGSFNLQNNIASVSSLIGYDWHADHQKNSNSQTVIHDKITVPIKKLLQSTHNAITSDDLAFWITKICNKANLKPSIFDVGSDQVIEMGVLAKLFSELFKVKIRRNKLKKNKIDKYVPNIHAAKKKLGLKIKYNLKDSILLTINRINEKKN